MVRYIVMEAAGLFETQFMELRDEQQIEKSPHLPLPDTESERRPTSPTFMSLAPAHCE